MHTICIGLDFWLSLRWHMHCLPECVLRILFTCASMVMILIYGMSLITLIRFILRGHRMIFRLPGDDD